MKWYEHPVVLAISIITGGCLVSERMAQKHQERVNDQRIRLAKLTGYCNDDNDEDEEES